ncbi:hypothetical protein DICPUDRAFT_80236 [Dictyostelium purpureum]|uniref:Uncharacterized protein n=1 Tax=Dictyostelium purpureum TaxID=5786 RepID=F0ZPX1_DICPU|nr:uncharacterized protein DICPUDRAFT_80236 [Dictyostelium purpureum]EGC34017.1 hypothetical protein DICPUDRAFT_80236 [Dictyostelium purpureum]|eukprot:XP_003289461.1 hypothetical protein DICPUDRAFT_80236 [Dictyostelium purpureum]
MIKNVDYYLKTSIYKKEFFSSPIIAFEEFKLIYNDFKHDFNKISKNTILKLCFLNRNHSKELIQYLIDFHSFKLDVYHFELYYQLLYNHYVKEDDTEDNEDPFSSSRKNINLFNFIINCFKNLASITYIKDPIIKPINQK